MINIFALAALGATLCTSCSDDDKAYVIEYVPNQVELGVEFADPFIMLDGDTYYA